MNKIFIFGGIIAAFLVGYAIISRDVASSEYLVARDNVVATSTPKLPWIEVESPRVSLSGATTTELRSGDFLAVGATVITSQTGRATIHFPDGSVARLDPMTELVVDRATYSETTGSLAVQLSLRAGKVWSRVMSLLTKDSAWEVETSNAVVTVRGTAFGVQYETGKKKSLVLGSENNVAVRRRMSDALERTMSDKEKSALATIVSPSIFVSIDGGPAVQNASGNIVPEKIILQRVTTSMAQSDWVSRNQTADREDARRIEELQRKLNETSPGTPDSIRSELQKEAEIQREQLEQQTIPVKPTSIMPVDIPVESTKPVTESAVLSPVPKLIATGIEIVVNSPREILKEGDILTFSSFALMSDGTKRKVTAEVLWKVRGDIGVIAQDGTFAAKLLPAVAELGTARGDIVAAWKDPVTGKIFTAMSKVIQVDAAPVDEPVDMRG